MNARNLLVAAAMLGVAVPAGAEGVYIGGKIGVMDVDDSAFDDATNAGILLGYEFPASGIASVGFEAEFTTTVSDGDFNAFGVSGDWDIDTQAIYAVVRIGDQVYAKGRIGYLNEDVSVSVGNVSADGSDSGGSLGVGFGVRATDRLNIEAEYTKVEEDVDFWSVGVNLYF